LEKRIGKFSVRFWRNIFRSLDFKEKLVVSILSGVIAVSFFVWFNAIYNYVTKPIPKFGGEYSEGVVGQPLYVNPLLSQTSEADSDITQLVFSGLFKYDKDGRIVNDIAEKYELSEDHLQYTIHLRKNVKWHDGADLNADDVFFTYNIIQDPSYKSPLRQSWQGVTVDKIDENTVVFNLKNPFVGFLDSLTVGILPKHIWENISPEKFALAEYNLNPVGSGPYMFTDFQKDSKGNILTYHLSAFKNFYDGVPYITKFTFDFYLSDDDLLMAYNKKEIMGMGNVAPEKNANIKNIKSTNLREIVIPRYFAMFTNQTKSFSLADDAVRKALNVSIDRKQIIDTVLRGKGEPLDSPFFPGMAGYEQVDSAAKIDEANKILDEAGWKIDTKDGIRKKNEIPFEFELVTTDWPELIQTADILSQQWKKIGANVKVNAMSISDLQQNYIKTRNYDALLFGQATNFYNPDLYSYWHSNMPGLNLANFENKDADAKLDEIRQEFNQDKLDQNYKDLHAILSRENPAIFLYGQKYLYPTNVSLQGVDVKNINSPAQRFVNVNKWYVRTSRVFK
jgi:peptide/nickel transport system substrate-binding protein